MNGEEKVVNVAKEEVGYLEKRSNKDLDSKTANVGNNNYTKYARDLFPTLQGQPWCDMFVDWCFVQAFGQVQEISTLIPPLLHNITKIKGSGERFLNRETRFSLKTLFVFIIQEL